MKRNKNQSSGKRQGLWLITFADMVTLLLTFFVLLFSMSSMDSSIIARISLDPGPVFISFNRGGWDPFQSSHRLEKILKEKGSGSHNLEDLEKLIFPEESWPLEVPRFELGKSVEIVEGDNGIVIILSGDLIFNEGESKISLKAEKILAVLKEIVDNIGLDINISGYASLAERDFFARTAETESDSKLNDRDGESSGDRSGEMSGESSGERARRAGMLKAQELSALRAINVLDYFLQGQARPERFSISGYGASKLRFQDSTEADKNRRVEILLKVKRRLGDYA